jgi:hypothetical protein
MRARPAALARSRAGLKVGAPATRRKSWPSVVISAGTVPQASFGLEVTESALHEAVERKSTRPNGSAQHA